MNHVDCNPRLDPELMHQFYLSALVGTKEFRNWLALYDEAFKQVRDPDVDAQIDEQARRRKDIEQQWAEHHAENIKEDEDNDGRMMDREGNVD